MGAQPSPSPDADEVVKIGSVLDGRYRIDAILGTGGMGRVYRGEHTGIGRQVAIKVLHADLGRNREAAQRFQREAIASGRLDHANIVGVSDFGIIDDGPCYLVMEALEGESLGDRLQRETRVPWNEAIDIIRGVLHGLRHAHDRGVVHRDIKPDNIFLAKKDGGSIVKILDFGIAKLAAGTPDDPVSTRAGLTVGTPAYLSPEQAVGGEITPACDLYSVTIVLFEMLAGKPPFEDKDPLAMLGAHVGRVPAPVSEIAPDLALPAGLEEVIAKGLEKLVADRFTSAFDYLAALDQVAPVARFASHPGISVSPYATPPSGVGIVPAAAAAEIGSAPTATLTPVPSTSTPLPTAHQSPVAALAATSMLSPSKLARRPRHPSIADVVDPIPKKWVAIGALTIVGLLILAVILLAARAQKDRIPTVPNVVPENVAPATKPGAKTVKPAAKPEAKAETKVEPPPVEEPPETPADLALKAALHDLTAGKTCPDRKKAVARLVTLNDPRAIPDLKTARYRMVGGLVGIGADNANACLTADATAAIKKLTPPAPKK